MIKSAFFAGISMCWNQLALLWQLPRPYFIHQQLISELGSFIVCSAINVFNYIFVREMMSSVRNLKRLKFCVRIFTTTLNFRLQYACKCKCSPTVHIFHMINACVCICVLRGSAAVVNWTDGFEAFYYVSFEWYFERDALYIWMSEYAHNAPHFGQL